MKKTIKFLTALLGSSSLLMSVSALAEYRTFNDGNITYGIFQAKPEEVQLHWKDAEGNDYQSLTRLKNALEDDPDQVLECRGPQSGKPAQNAACHEPGCPRDDHKAV